MSGRLRLPLHAVAHGRAGDKGDVSNVSVIAYRPEAWPHLLEQATAERALEIFAHLGATGCRRHELPKLRALNFVIENALGGGVNAALGLDRHGKTLSFLLLGELTVDVPRDAVPDGSPYLTTDGPATGRGTAIRSTTDQGTAVRPATD